MKVSLRTKAEKGEKKKLMSGSKGKQEEGDVNRLGDRETVWRN